MLHLFNFLLAVDWTGEVPGAGVIPAMSAATAMGRVERVVIEAIGGKLPARF